MGEKTTYGFNLKELFADATIAGKLDLADVLETLIKKEKVGEDIQEAYDRLAQCHSAGQDLLTISPSYLLNGTIDMSEAE